MDRALVPCSPHRLLFAKVEYSLPLCLPTWGCSLPERCPALQPSVSCCSTWGQLLASPAQHPWPWCALYPTLSRAVVFKLVSYSVQTWDQSMPGMGVQDCAC